MTLRQAKAYMCSLNMYMLCEPYFCIVVFVKEFDFKSH